MTLSEILKRLEAGETGREIDGAIYCALNPGWVGDAAGHVAASPGWLRSPYLSTRKRGAPRYTTSLDAALTLVPSPWRAVIEAGDNYASVYLRRGWGYAENRRTPSWEVADGKAAPRLVCIAALKAREAQHD